MAWHPDRPTKQGYYWLRRPRHTKGGEVVYIGKEPKSKRLYVLTFGHTYDEREPLEDCKFDGAWWANGIDMPSGEYNPPLKDAGFMDLVCQLVKVIAAPEASAVLQQRPAKMREAAIQLQLAAEHYMETVEGSSFSISGRPLN